MKKNGSGCCKTSHRTLMGAGRAVLLGLMVLGAVTAMPLAAENILANTCNGRSELSYPTAPNFAAVGDTVRVRITLGAGSIDGGSSLTLNRVRFELDCVGGGDLGLGCQDDGDKISFQGNISSSVECGSVTWTADHSPGDLLPNEVVFSPSSPLVIPENTSGCAIEFDVRIENQDSDVTPSAIEQVSGYRAGASSDAVCNTTPALQAGNTSSGSLRVCPSCDDSNVCTNDACNRNADPSDEAQGCVHEANTLPCNDNNACTSGDICGNTICNGPTPVICVDENPCTDDSCDPAVGCVFTNNSLPCSDGNACTALDICVNGSCSPGGPTNCDDGNACTADSCDPVTGCLHAPIDVNDNNACTTDTCDPATGPVHTPVDCNDNNACTSDTCDPAIGCVHTPVDVNDGNACTTDTCDPATGPVHTPVDCNDSNACTTDTCDPAVGCVYTIVDCNDSNACTTDTCDTATGCVYTPVDVNDNNACTTDTCVPATGPVHTPVDCNDNNACTTDTCDPASGPVHTPVDCNDSNACTTDSCNPATGCVHGTTDCNDSNACTTDTCDPATGCGHTAIICADNNICTDDSCNPASGCVFTNNNHSCDDNTVCNGHEVCTGGACGPGSPLNCDDNNACTNDSCDPVFGCQHTNNTNPCDDGNVCTTTDVCTGGICVGSGHLDCDDHNICTDDCCLPSVPGGCINVPNTNPCDDGSICNGREICAGGVCTRGSELDCDDHNICTDDCCDGVTGCTHTSVPECTQAQTGCLVTGGGVMTDGTINPNIMASLGGSLFCGKVAAAPGMIHYPDEQGQIEGFWTHQRKHKSSLHVNSYGSLACGCGGNFSGILCDPSGMLPQSQMAEANSVCFSGVGEYSTKKSGRGKQVVFRAVLEDHGDPAASGQNNQDVYRIQIWIPKRGETINDLATSVACTIPTNQLTVRPANFNDGGNLMNGNVTIRPDRTSNGTEMPH